MNKKMFIDKLAERIGLSKKDTGVVVDEFMNVLKEGLVKEGKVTFAGVMSLETKDVPERTGVIQMGEKKGETWVKPAHKKLIFKTGKSLTDVINA